MARKLNEREAPKEYERGNAPFESKRVPEDQIREKGYLYFSTHGIGPGTKPRDVRQREIDYDLPGGWCAFKTDRPLTSEELDWYDIQPETRNRELKARFKINEAEEDAEVEEDVRDDAAMDELKERLQKIANDGDALVKDVAEDQLDEVDSYDTPQDFLEHLTNLYITGGGVSSMIYYDDTLKFLEDHEEEINELLKDGIREFGSLQDMFGKNYDDTDPMNLGTSNRNLFAWYAYEETARNIAYQLNDEYDYNASI